MNIEHLNSESEEVKALIETSDRFYSGLYPSESNHLTSSDELRQKNMIFIGARVDGNLVASGAARLMSDDGDYAEIKRVFVLNSHRGQGLSLAIMQFLEQEVMNHGIRLMRLETGVRQDAAIGLYRKLGYHERGPFGAYQSDPHSVFMEKTGESSS